MGRATTTTPHDGPEDRWEDAALRWALGLGALAGAWWAVFALAAARALAAGEVGLAAPTAIVGLLPNMLWAAAARPDRAVFWLGCLEALWRRSRRGGGRRAARRSALLAASGAALWATAKKGPEQASSKVPRRAGRAGSRHQRCGSSAPVEAWAAAAALADRGHSPPS